MEREFSFDEHLDATNVDREIEWAYRRSLRDDAAFTFRGRTYDL